MAPRFEHRHVVGFEETNLLGNVYFTHFVRWQGHCREAFLKEKAPDVVALFAGGFRLVTLKCSCEYLAELRALDDVTIGMGLESLVQNRMTLSFEYRRGGELVARGEQVLAAMAERDGRLDPASWPSSLLDALRPYRT